MISDANASHPEVIARFRLLDLLGEGASATVHRACSIDDPSHQVAIKLSKDSWSARHLETRVRFEHEADLLARLSHPNIVRLFRYGVFAEHLYLITELARGRSLEALVASRVVVAPVRAAKILQQIALALSHAHEKRVLHRDIKPSNVVVSEADDLTVKVLDFGLSRVLEQPGASDAVGTFRYMSPEQLGILPHPADERSDLYSLGILAIELLTRKHPFGDLPLRELIHCHAAVVPELPGSIPLALRRIIDLLVRKDPSERYASAKGVAADLESYLARGLDDDGTFELRTHDTTTELTPPTFLGRAAEAVALREAYGRAKGGEAQIVSVAGLSGMGKTRLLGHAARDWTASVVLWGRGRAYGQAAAYGLIAEALRGVTGQAVSPALLKRFQDAAGELGAEILKIVPELRPLFGEVPEAVTLEPERRQQRFLSLVGDLFIALATTDAPLVLILDDLQWADEGSLHLCLHLARVMRPYPVVLVLAYRAEEVAPGSRVERILEQIREGRTLYTITLAPLEPPDVRTLVASMLGTELDEASHAVTAQAGGSPLHAIELTYALVESGALRRTSIGWEVADRALLTEARFSDGLIKTIVGRLERLTEQQRSVLEVAAVVGRNFQFSVLVQSMQLSNDERAENLARRVVDALEAAEQARLVAPLVEPGSYTFGHDKIREAIYEKLEDKRRSALHYQVGCALEVSSRDDPRNAYALAHHFLSSGDSDKAIDYSIRAGDLAHEQHAHLEALDFYEQAEKRALQLPAGARKSGLVLHIAEGIGDACGMTGYYPRAIERYELALSEERSPEAISRLRRKLGRVLFAKGEATKAAVVLEGALTALGEWVPTSRAQVFYRIVSELLIQIVHTFYLRKKPPDRDPTKVDIGRVYAQLTYVYYFMDSVRALASHLRHMNLLERENVVDALGHAWSSHGPACAMVPLFDRGVTYVKRSLALRQELNDRWGAAQSRHFLVLALSSAGRWQEAVDEGRLAEAEFEQLGDRWELVTLVVNIGASYARLGNWDMAERYADKTDRIATEIGHIAGRAYAVWLRGLIGARFDQIEFLGDLDKRLAECLEAGDLFSAAMVYAAKGKALLRVGENEAAEATLSAGAAVLRRQLLRTDYVIQMYPGLVEAILRQATASADPKARRDHLRRARTALRVAKVLTFRFPNHRVYVLRMEAKLLWGAGRRRAAERVWRNALSIAIEQHQVYQQALCLMEWGMTTRDVDLRKGDNLLSAAWPLLKGLGATTDLALLSAAAPESFRELRAERLPALSSGSYGSYGGAGSTTGRALENERLSSLVEISRRLSATLDVDGLLQAIVDSAARVLGAERGVLFLWDAQASELQERKVFGVQEGNDTPVSASVLEDVRTTGRGVVLADAQVDPKLKGAASVIASGVRSVLCAPLLFHGRLLGAVYLDNRLMRGLFTTSDLEILEALASQAAVALENASAFAELARSKRDLEGFYEASRELLGVVDRRRIFRVLLDVTLRMTKASGAAILRFDGPRASVILQSGLSPARIEDLEARLVRAEIPITLFPLADGARALATTLALSSDTEGALVVVEPEHAERSRALLTTLCSQSSLALENAKLYELAITDELTRLYQRRYYETILGELTEKKEPFALIYLDLDGFKPINDTFGHHVGDLVLSEVGRVMQRSLRATDLAARLGGDEFAVVLPGTPPHDAELVVEKLREGIAAITIDVAGPSKPRVGSSFGLAFSEGGDLRAVQELADQRLYENKRRSATRRVAAVP